MQQPAAGTTHGLAIAIAELRMWLTRKTSAIEAYGSVEDVCDDSVFAELPHGNILVVTPAPPPRLPAAAAVEEPQNPRLNIHVVWRDPGRVPFHSIRGIKPERLGKLLAALDPIIDAPARDQAFAADNVHDDFLTEAQRACLRSMIARSKISPSLMPSYLGAPPLAPKSKKEHSGGQG